jgi:carbonic anhydrase
MFWRSCVSTRVLGSKEIMLLNHAKCGFTGFTDAELNEKFSKLTEDSKPAPMRFFLLTRTRNSTPRSKSKWSGRIRGLLKISPVRGFVFDVDTGRLREVAAYSEAAE